MATYEHNALMQYIDEKGNIHINYPATKAENVMMGNSDAQTEITARVKTSDVLYTLEEISACTDFTNKISGAKAVSEVNQTLQHNKRKANFESVSLPFTAQKNGTFEVHFSASVAGYYFIYLKLNESKIKFSGDSTYDVMHLIELDEGDVVDIVQFGGNAKNIQYAFR